LNLEVFCYLGLLRFPEQLEPSLALLPEPERAEAVSLMGTLKALPRAELLRRWGRLRGEEFAAALRQAQEQTGMRLDQLPPSLRPWIISRLADHDG
jgi:hypothetical protein